MTATKYIRPMSFFETLGSMYRLYLKIMFPILLLNIILVIMSWWVLIVGAFVGPVLMMTSNAILGKPLKVWDSFRRGIFSVSFLKIAIASIGYIILISIPAIVALAFSTTDASIDASMVFSMYVYLILIPIWVFIPMIMLLEKKGLRASIKRSFRIVRKNFFRILQMDIFLIVIVTLMASFLNIIFEENAFSSLGVLIAFFMGLISGFSVLPYVFIYYEYRARHEDYSEELLTQEMGYESMEEMMSV